MKKYLFLLSIILLGLTMTACMDDYGIHGDYTEGNGDIGTFFIQTGEFNKIDVRCSGKVFVRKGDYNEVEVKIDRNLYNNLNIYTSENELVIDLDNASPTEFEVYVTVKDFVALQEYSSADIEVAGDFVTDGSFNIDMDGSGDVYMKQLSAKNITINIVGSGDLKLYANAERIKTDLEGSGNCTIFGKIEEAELEVYSSGDLDMRSVINDNASIIMDGSGDVKIHTIKSVDISILGAGDAYLYERPEKITSIINGSGKIIYMK